MDPLSISASIIAVIQLTGKVIEYVNAVQDAPKERANVAIEISNLFNLLVTIRYRLEEGRSNEPWYAAIKSLGVRNGPLDQYKYALEELQRKIVHGSMTNRIGQALVWKFGKEEVKSLLSRIESLKSVIHIALEMDHL